VSRYLTCRQTTHHFPRLFIVQAPLERYSVQCTHILYENPYTYILMVYGDCGPDDQEVCVSEYFRYDVCYSTIASVENLHGLFNVARINNIAICVRVGCGNRLHQLGDSFGSDVLPTSRDYAICFELPSFRFALSAWAM
jgi:hypothetical protein